MERRDCWIFAIIYPQSPLTSGTHNQSLNLRTPSSDNSNNCIFSKGMLSLILTKFGSLNCRAFTLATNEDSAALWTMDPSSLASSNHTLKLDNQYKSLVISNFSTSTCVKQPINFWLNMSATTLAFLGWHKISISLSFNNSSHHRCLRFNSLCLNVYCKLLWFVNIST